MNITIHRTPPPPQPEPPIEKVVLELTAEEYRDVRYAASVARSYAQTFANARESERICATLTAILSAK